jgi:adenylosuccinate synthase
MKEYINFINKYLETNVHYISNGPGRDQIIELSEKKPENQKNIFKNLAN